MWMLYGITVYGMYLYLNSSSFLMILWGMKQCNWNVFMCPCICRGKKLIAGIISACCLPLLFEFLSGCQRRNKLHWHLRLLRLRPVSPSCFHSQFLVRSVFGSTRLDGNLERKARSNGTFSTLIRSTNNNFISFSLASTTCFNVYVYVYVYWNWFK